jgi:four helix bundle protein
VGSFKNLEVWRQAHALTLAVYGATRSFPAAERYALQSQLRRSAVSIASNIAEGGGRRGDRAFVHFLRIARGSAAELEYQLLVARDLDLLVPGDWQVLEARTQRVSRMLLGLIRRFEREGAPACRSPLS